jgi:threonine dehydratase
LSHPPTFEGILKAAQRIAPYIHRTPVLTSRLLDSAGGASLFFKCENFQKGGAFKIRGACNAVFSLPEERAARGVAAHSSGNHAAALSLAARWRGIPAFVVMPENAPAVKKAAVAGYGGNIVFCEPTLAAREKALSRVVAETGAEIVHPYDDARVIEGQGTAALELLGQIEGLDIVIAPVGGGGLVGGAAIAAKSLFPDIVVIAAEPLNADDAYRSKAAGKILPPVDPDTIADGLRTGLGALTFPIIREKVDAVITVREETIVEAMRLIWERMKIVVEPSGAVPFGAVLTRKIDSAGKRVGVILSGGNTDLSRLPW